MADPNISKIIKERRIDLEMSLEDVGKGLGLNRSTILRWENGQIKGIKRSHIYLLSNILHLPVEKLLGFDTKDEIEDPEVIKARMDVIKKLELIKNKEDLEDIGKYISFMFSKK